MKTPFTEAHPLTLPHDRGGFTFAVLADRTTGPTSGLAILEQAVAELNHLDPDLVMNVGDMINGYNKPAEWIAQMQRYKKIMSWLKMPWYPTPGNHDVYPPGGDKSNRANEKLYLEHFGPLYYSFDHRNAHFIVLYSDEKLSFRNPAVDQQISQEQLQWLKQDLEAANRRHTFVFLHHPRWNYEGDVWEPVHEVLKDSGKVTAVIAGHWHRYRSDGVRDGIHYYCLATTGGSQDELPAAGYIHHYNLVTVREDGWSMAVVPVGVVLDPDFVTGDESNDVLALRSGEFLSLDTVFPAPVDGMKKGEIEVTLTNPTTKKLEFTLQWAGLPGEGWRVDPAEGVVALEPGEEKHQRFMVQGDVPAEGEPLPGVSLEAAVVYPLDKGGRQPVSTVGQLAYEVPAMPEELARDGAAEVNRALVLDGRDNCVFIDDAADLNPAGPFTLECWARLEAPGDRAALVAKTQSSSYGLWLADEGRKGPWFIAYIENRGYARAEAGENDLAIGKWTHYAGVYDGQALHVYVNGQARATLTLEPPGKLRPNDLPLVVGADVDRGGKAVSFAAGLVDEVRLSGTVRYNGPFEPARRFVSDGETVLLLHMDKVFGNLTPDTSGRGHHGRISGGARLVAVE